MRGLARFVGRFGEDLLALLGFVCVTYGVSRWSVPAAWVVSGCLLMAVAIVPHLRRSKHGPAE